MYRSLSYLAYTSPSAAPRRMSCSETSTRSSPNRLHHLLEDQDPGDDRRRAVGVQARDLGGAPRASAASQPGEDPCASLGVEHVAVDARRGRRARDPGRSRPATWRCRRPRSPRLDGAARCGSGTAAARIARTSADSSARSASVGGSVCRWRSVWRTTPAWVETWNSTSPPGADHHLGRAAADVEHERRRRVGGVALAGRAEERQPRLLVAGQHVRLEPVAVLDLGRRTAAPLAESRTALVSTATPRVAAGSARSAAV